MSQIYRFNIKYTLLQNEYILKMEEKDPVKDQIAAFQFVVGSMSIEAPPTGNIWSSHLGIIYLEDFCPLVAKRNITVQSIKNDNRDKDQIKVRLNFNDFFCI